MYATIFKNKFPPFCHQKLVGLNIPAPPPILVSSSPVVKEDRPPSNLRFFSCQTKFHNDNQV